MITGETTTAETKSKKRTRKPKAKQEEFQADGMSQKKIPELEEYGADYAEKRDERCMAQIPEKTAKALLLAAMKKHGFGPGQVYKMEDGRPIEIAHKDETVKVGKVKDDDGVGVGDDE